MSNVQDIRLTRVSLALTTLLAITLMGHFWQVGRSGYLQENLRLAIEASACGAAALFLMYGNLLYQWCRLGFYRRRRAHVPAAREVLERIYDRDAPSLAVLIPSYKEEPHVVWQTMLSAALTEYPAKSVVLLIDDPPHPEAAEDRQRLTEVRDLVRRLDARFLAAEEYFTGKLNAFLERRSIDPAIEAERLAGLYMEAAHLVKALASEWLHDQTQSASPHADAFFMKGVVEALVAQHTASADALARGADPGSAVDRATLMRHHRRLAAFFRVRFSSFERKRYANLSHEANKAMNLNSYIGLMGKSWREIGGGTDRRLERVEHGDIDFVVKAPDYLIALDADSILLPDYALRLVHVMEQPEHAQLAVVQTPYSAFPGPAGTLERVAGATTDLQYVVHQGFSDCDATFWVGANALIRRRALEDIREARDVNGESVPVFIQDRTLIEDTESSIDLARAGWKLHNYPERLSYSATPPDFGSLLIQRRRWANGGLLIVPKLLRYSAGRDASVIACQEFIARFHYLFSLAGGSAAVLLLFLYPFDNRLATLWLAASTLPYFILYARDLRLAGYRHADVLRVYALNLALVPVVTAGVLKSLQQGLTGVKGRFRRTPKIASRTAMPAWYCAVALALPVLFLAEMAWDVERQRWLHAAFSVLNAGFFAYALVALLGVGDTFADLLAGFRPTDTPATADDTSRLADRLPNRQPGREVAASAFAYSRASKDLVALGQEE